jgi:choline dehydrogenase-like flavoprotein
MKRILTKHERKIIAALAEVLIPLKEGTADMPRMLDLIEEHIRLMNIEMRSLYRMCLWIIELSAFFYYGCLKTMTKMPVDKRERYINAWHNTWWSFKRTIKRFLETVIFMNYYSIPPVAASVCGYDPVFKPAMSARDFPSENLIRNIPDSDVTEDVDVCVIGSGAGGAVVAKELAEKGHSVVILEEGGFFTDLDFGKDAVSMIKMMYKSGGVVNTFGWPPILVPVGSCVGGTTLINSGTCFRTPDAVFEKWVNSFGLASWAASRMQKHYEEVEKLLEIETAKEEVQAGSAKLFARGLASRGVEIKPLVRNAPDCCGSGVCCFGCPTNAKLSVQLSYIPLALRAGARLYTRCQVRKILFRRRHAYSAEGRFRYPSNGGKGPRIDVRAKIIIAACGAIHTPVLLKRSRVPNLSGQLGHNLTLHPAAKVIALFDEEVRGWEGIPQGHYSEALADEGIMLEGIFLQPAFTASTLLLTGCAHREVMEKYKHLALFGMMVSDTSRGRIFKGINGDAVPVYNINRTDLPKYRRGIQFIADVFFAAGAKKVFLPLHTLPELNREEGIKPLIELKLRNKDLDLQAFHPLGTCRMGAEPLEAVLDPYARVYGLDNFFVADGSIFPTSLGVNPMVTIMAAAHKIADHIHREHL